MTCKKNSGSIYKYAFSVLFCINFLDSFCEEKKIIESIKKCDNKMHDNVDANASSVYQSTVDGINYVTNFCYHNPVYAVLGAVAICGGFVGLYYAFTSVGLAKSTALGVGSATLGSTTSTTSIGTQIVNEKAISSVGETIGEKIIKKAIENLSEEASINSVLVSDKIVTKVVANEQSLMVDICKFLIENSEKLLSIDSPGSPLVTFNPDFASTLLGVTKFVVDNPSLLYSIGFLSASCLLSTSKISSTTNLRIAHFIRDRAINPSFFKDVDIKDHIIVLKDSIGIKIEEENRAISEVVDDLVSKVEANKVVGEVVDELVNKVVEKNTSPTMNVANNTLYLVNLQVPAMDIVGGSFEMDFRSRQIDEICDNILITNDNKIYFKKQFRKSMIEHYQSDPNFYKIFMECTKDIDLSSPENKNYFVYYRNEKITKQNIVIFSRLGFNLSCATGSHLHLLPEPLRNVMFADVGDINAFKEAYDPERDPFLEYLKENPTKIFSNKSAK